MTFPTDWDVEKYRTEHECEEHWELRRRFLDAHKDKYPEDRLVCLAQVFYNVEFMGCRYPEKTMCLVAKLSQGIADDHREKMKTKLQRTFVQASDAASTKVKGRSRNGDTAQSTMKPIQFHKSTENKLSIEDQQSADTKNVGEVSLGNLPRHQRQFNAELKNAQPSLNEQSLSNSNVPGRYVLADQSCFQEQKPKKKRKRNQREQEPQHSPPKRMRTIGDLASRLVLLKHGEIAPYGILSSSAAASALKLKLEILNETKNGIEATLSMDGVVLSKAVDTSVDKAKKKCAAECLAKLQKICPTLIVKNRLAGSVVEKSDVSGDPGENNAQSQESNEVHNVAEDSKVNRMMKLMGWGGGGLGKNEQGREKPVEVVERVNRAGLGISLDRKESQKEFNKRMTELLQNYKRSQKDHDLVFASDFSKEERALVHVIARKCNLKSTSFGKEAERQLVVSKKKTPLAIVEEVQRAGGSTAKYDLILPGSS